MLLRPSILYVCRKRIVVDRRSYRVMSKLDNALKWKHEGITETLYWFYNLVLFYACGRLYALRLYNSLCFYTTGLLYASTTLLYADCQFCFIPLYVSTHVRFYDLLSFYTTVRFYASTMLLNADCQFCLIPLYVSTAHFALTRLDDSTHLRCYCKPTVSFALHHCTFLRIYGSTTYSGTTAKACLDRARPRPRTRTRRSHWIAYKQFVWIPFIPKAITNAAGNW